MSKDTFYFSHDYNTRSDIKVKDLIAEHGMLGYGIFWSIIEDLYNNANALPTKYKTIAYELRVDESVVSSVINDFDLFTMEDGFFGSLSVQRRLDERSEKSINARKSALKRWERKGNDANALQSESAPNAIKERKGKERKEKEIKEDNILLEKETKYNIADFKNDLLNYGFKENLIDDWLKVRKTKKASNTKTALNGFIKQIELNGNEKNYILEQCVVNSWGGFKSEWLIKNTPQEQKSGTNQIQNKKTVSYADFMK